MTVPPTWTTPHGRLSLGFGDTHVWLVTVGEQEIPEKHLESLLSLGELQSCVRMVRVADRRRFVAVRAALRSILAAYLRMSPSSVIISYSASGKPLLENQPLHFNVSHAGDLALIAVSHGFAVGVDIEQLSPGRAFHGILEDFFGPSEQSWVLSQPREHQAEAFFRVWTRREAASKAAGVGLFESFSRFGFPASDPSALGFPLQLTGLSQDWWLRDLDPAPGCVGALCVQETNPAPVFLKFIW